MKLPAGIMAVTRQREVGQARVPEECHSAAVPTVVRMLLTAQLRCLGESWVVPMTSLMMKHGHEPGLLSAEHGRCRLQVESVAPQSTSHLSTSVL